MSHFSYKCKGIELHKQKKMLGFVVVFTSERLVYYIDGM